MCKAAGCRIPVPRDLETEELCLLHFTLDLEETCAGIRRETVRQKITRERIEEIFGYISEKGEKLAHAATAGAAQTDEMKSRILSTFLTLMNCRENVDRSLRQLLAARTFSR